MSFFMHIYHNETPMTTIYYESLLCKHLWLQLELEHAKRGTLYMDMVNILFTNVDFAYPNGYQRFSHFFLKTFDEILVYLFRFYKNINFKRNI